MSRMWLRIILICAVTPGCQHLSPPGSIAREDLPPRVLAAASDSTNMPREGKIVSTAMAQTEAVSPPQVDQNVQAKKQTGPTDVDNRPLPHLPVLDPKPDAPAGRPAIVYPGIPENTQPKLTPTSQQTKGQGEPVSQPLPIPIQAGKTADKRNYKPLLNALQCMLEGRHQEAIQHLRAYDQETEEFFLRLLPPLTIMVKKPIDELTPAEIVVLTDQLSGIMEMLRPRCELVINKMCYCRRIRGFGQHDDLPEGHAFLAGSADRPGEMVQVYVELKNFASEPVPDGSFLTKLACTLELHDSAGKKVWSHTYDRSQTTHRRQARLNDLHNNFSFFVPPQAPGAYQLTIQITDETNPELRERVVRKSLDFRITPGLPR